MNVASKLEYPTATWQNADIPTDSAYITTGIACNKELLKLKVGLAKGASAVSRIPDSGFSVFWCKSFSFAQSANFGLVLANPLGTQANHLSPSTIHKPSLLLLVFSQLHCTDCMTPYPCFDATVAKVVINKFMAICTQHVEGLIVMKGEE